MATKIFCDRCHSSDKVREVEARRGQASSFRFDLCDSCMATLSQTIKHFMAAGEAPITPKLDLILDQFVADKPKDILK